jgi:hypothetical protein
MASVGNGTATFSLKPRQWNQGSDQYSTFNERGIYLMSVNAPMRWQVLYEKNTQQFTEEVAPTTSDVVNVIFTIYGTSLTIDAGAPFSKWEKIAVIKKSRDVANKTMGGVSHTDFPTGHRFTVDISSICNDLLSYSLCPIGKGTWARDSIGTNNNIGGYRGGYGGMNGDGHPQDNNIIRISTSKVTQNGAYRFIKVQAGFEILQDDGTVVTATNNLGADILIRDESWVVAINSTPQWEEDSVYYTGGTWGTKYFMDRYNSWNSFLSKCPNFSRVSGSGSEIMKDVRMTDEAEWLYFWIFRTLGDTYRDPDLTYWASGAMLEVTTSDGNTVYVDNFKSLLRLPFGQFVGQYRYCVQNVSPDFIANNAKTSAGAATGTPFTANTEWYSVRYVNLKNTDSSVVGLSQFRNYKIDREAEHPFGYVRFHWLNRLGGIDSYTAKRNVIEGISVNKNTFEAKSPDKMWLQLNEPILLDDSVRGDLYRGGREVLNVNANRNHSVYTDPLNKAMAKWLEELITSPNVWIEHESEATKRRKSNTASLRPSDKTYIPIIITNSDVETVNQESGLVKFNIDFTHSHSINTQRN